MRYSELKTSIVANFQESNDVPVIILGKPGGGKSALARDIIRTLGIKPERTTEFNPSLRDPVDIMGLPRTDGDHSVWVPPSEFYRLRDDNTDEPCALILEELTDATVPMQNPMCRVVLDRYAGELKLHPKLFIIATGNRVEDKSGATRMTTKLANRMQVLDFDENLNDWIEWATANKVNNDIVQYLRLHPRKLSDFDANRPVNATPRSWAMANKISRKLDESLYLQNIAGLVSEGHAIEFLAFRKMMLSADEVINALINPQAFKVPQQLDRAYAYAASLVQHTTIDKFDNFLILTEKFSPEIGVAMIKDIVRVMPEVTGRPKFREVLIKFGNILF